MQTCSTKNIDDKVEGIPREKTNISEVKAPPFEIPPIITISSLLIAAHEWLKNKINILITK